MIMKECTPDDFDSCIINRDPGVIVFLLNSAHFSDLQLQEIRKLPDNLSVNVFSIEDFDSQFLQSYDVSGSPFFIFFNSNYITLRFPGFLTSQHLSSLMMLNMSFDMSIPKQEIGEVS